MKRKQAQNASITKDKILEILKDYRDLNKHVMQLEFELTESVPLVTDEEIIVSLAINESSVNGKAMKGASTEDIALSYEKIADGINIKHRKSLEDELGVLKKKKERIEYYISLLDSKQANALRLIYFEGLTFNEAAEQLFISSTSLKYMRSSGIKKLVEMYGNIIENEG